MDEGSDRIAVFVSFSGAGGVERMVVNLTRGWTALGRSVDLLLVRRAGPHLARLPAGARQLQMGHGHALTAIPALARYLSRERPRALLAVKERAGRAAVLARALAGTNTPILLRLGTHLSTAMAHKSAAQRWLRYAPIRLLYPRIEGIIAVSQGVAEDTIEIARLPRERVLVIPNPVITPELRHQAAAPCPHPWLSEQRAPVIIGSGRLERQKDFPTLLRAFARLRQTRDCRLIILGEGRSRAELVALAAELGVATDLDMPGYQDNPYAFVARASLFVLSSAWEGSPNVLTEAMALGTPVVATDCPSGPAELLDHGRHGPLVPVGDARALAQAMAATLDDPPHAERLRAAVAAYEQPVSARRYLEAMTARPCAG